MAIQYVSEPGFKKKTLLEVVKTNNSFQQRGSCKDVNISLSTTCTCENFKLYHLSYYGKQD